MSFHVNFPFLWILLSLILAGLVTYLIYRNNPLKTGNRLVKQALAAFRFLSLFIICFLLLEPLLRWTSIKKEKPIIAIALDNSESVVTGKDSAYYRKEFPVQLEKLKEELGDKYEFKTYVFGESTRLSNQLDFADKLSNMADPIKRISDDFYNLNLSGIILASDGIFNKGENPVYQKPESNTRIYTIGLGDTSVYRDIQVKSVKYNEVVFEGNAFPVQPEIKAVFSKGLQTEIEITEGSKTLVTQKSSIGTDNYYHSEILTLPPATEGIHRYTIRAKPVKGERNLVNNTYEIQVNVIRSKQKIVLIAHTPHPDITAIKQSLETNPDFEVKSYLVSDFRESDLDASLFILHQVPGYPGNEDGLLKTITSKNKPVMFILGKQSDLRMLARYDILRINGYGQIVNEVQGYVNPSFPLFQTDENLGTALQKFAPMIAPYGNYTLPAGAETLLFQQIGYVKTNTPLLYFMRRNGTQQSVLCGEGFWRWRLQDFQINGNQNATGTLLSKIIQWTAGKSDQGRFRVNPIKNSMDENESVEFEAELYNEIYEPVNQPDIGIILTNEKGGKYTYTFSKTEKAYKLDAGKLPPGLYNYEAKVSGSSSLPVKKGKFSIKPVQTEWITTTADHDLLRTVALENNGEFYLPTQLSALAEHLKKDELSKPVVYENPEVKELISMKWIFFILIALMASEWFIRKWNGFI